MVRIVRITNGERVMRCDARSVPAFIDRGWSYVDPADVPTAGAHPVLADLVDDRALEPLRSLGIGDVYGFLAAADADADALTALPYVTTRTVAKIRAAMEG